MRTDFFKWNKTFETGIIKIDIQHKVIIVILNELYDIIIGNQQEYKIDDTISELVRYAEYHFVTEEELFEKYNYSKEKEHKLEHRKFIEKINNLINHANVDRGTVAIELLNFLKDWLTDHILVTDQEYVSLFKTHEL